MLPDICYTTLVRERAITGRTE
jgi:hypothetical protein